MIKKKNIVNVKIFNEVCISFYRKTSTVGKFKFGQPYPV